MTLNERLQEAFDKRVCGTAMLPASDLLSAMTAIEQAEAENAALKEQVAQLEFRNERLVADYASVQEEIITIRRIHVHNIAIKDAEIARWKTVPMKYRRMEFNAQLQDENAELSKQLSTLQSKSAALVDALEQWKTSTQFQQVLFAEERLITNAALAAFKGEK